MWNCGYLPGEACESFLLSFSGAYFFSIWSHRPYGMTGCRLTMLPWWATEIDPFIHIENVYTEFYRKGIVSFGALELQHWLYLNIVESGRYWYFMIFFDCSCLFCRSRRRMPGLQSTKLESATEYALRVNQIPIRYVQIYNQRASVADYSGVPMNQCPQCPDSNFGNPRKTARRRWGPLNILASGPQRSLIRH